MQEIFTFDDVLIVPKFSTIESRNDVDLSVIHENLPYMRLPIISANMDSITGPEMAVAMSKAGGIGCLHRFCSIEESVKMFKESLYNESKEGPQFPMISIGLGNKELDRAMALCVVGAYTVIIDVAHGAQLSVLKQVKALRELLGDDISIIVGNFATSESVKTFLEYCPDINGIKVGIGPGSACTTRIKTGVGYPQLSAVSEIARLLKNTSIAIIADGGMRTPGDIAKALGAGANMVMLGGMLSGTDEAPGIEEWDMRKFATFANARDAGAVVKKYRGSASKESYGIQGKDEAYRTAEGESFWVPYKGPVKNVLQDIEGGLRSAFSYVGAKNIKEFHKRVEFVRITNSTLKENGAHGKS